MKAKILFLAPYLGLKELVESISYEYKDVLIDVYEGNYEKGPKILNNLNANENYDVIVTRGGTVETCKKVTNLPIIELYINAFDIIRILKLSEGYKGKKLFFAHKNIVEIFKKLSDLMGYSIEAKSYVFHKDVRGKLENLSKDYELIIGDNIVYETAHKIGFNSILLTSGVEGVKSSIEEAIRISNVIMDDKVRIINKNIALKNENIADYNKEKFIKVLEADEISPSLINTVFPKTILNLIKEMSATPLPTIIIGEDGMCKSDAGYLCCFYGSQKKKKLISVSCTSIPEDYNFELLYNLILDYLDNKEGGTLFLEDIDSLPKKSQKNILNILKKITKDNNIKIISSIEYPMETLINNGVIIKQLRSILDEVRIEFESFKEYKNEINNIISMYLAKLDVRCSTKVVGIKEKGIELLLNYNWPGNLRQFMRIINELTLTCKGAYILESDIKKSIKREKDNYSSKDLVPIDISGSLKEIETRIINKVMLEENMNQARVAKRLKIGNSTLWRKLK